MKNNRALDLLEINRESTKKPQRDESERPVTLVGVNDIVDAYGISRRTLERLRAAGKFPKPDVMFDRLPRWTMATIRAWEAENLKSASDSNETVSESVSETVDSQPE